MIDEKFVMEILQSREDRRDKQIDLINRYNSTLISFTLNTPGIVKDNEMYRGIHREGMKKISKLLIENRIPILFQKEINKSTGSEGYIAVDIDSIEVKKLLIALEETHPLGRIFDIDVFDNSHKQISRSDLGINPRRCLLCGKDASICAKDMSHSYEDLYVGIQSLWKEFNE